MIGVYKARVIDLTGKEAEGISRPTGWTTGWLLVRFKGNLRWARPCWPIGQYRPPSDQFLKVWAEKLTVWVIPEAEDDDAQLEDHLVYLGWEFHEDCLPDDVAAGFPKKQLSFTSNFEVVVTEDPTAPEVEVRYIDDDATEGTPAAKPIRFKLSKNEGKLTLALAAGEALEDLTLELSGVKGTAQLKLGDALAAVALAPKLMALYNSLKSAFDGHKHGPGTYATAVGGGAVTATTESGVPSSAAPAWDAGIASTQLLVPENPT